MVPDEKHIKGTPDISSKYLAIGITCLFGWVLTYMAIHILKEYAVGLFIWLPFVMGVLSTVFYAWFDVQSKRECRNVSFITLGVFCIGLLAFAFEGIICIIMAAPLGLVFTWLGSLAGYAIINKRNRKSAALVMLLLMLSVPGLMSFEYTAQSIEEQAKPIITTIEINAPLKTVWKNVVEFPQLDAPTEFIFKTGIAYPINAKISGSGVGAVRHCNFSTGSFVEPITVWDEPRLLKFNVAEQPEAMKELSFYDLHPNHLHGYFVSKQGQFRLTQLPNGHTLLEGTTWYYNKIKPAVYWTLWSDYIVHKIHQRVLNHIKVQSEKLSLRKFRPNREIAL